MGDESRACDEGRLDGEIDPSGRKGRRIDSRTREERLAYFALCREYRLARLLYE